MDLDVISTTAGDCIVVWQLSVMRFYIVGICEQNFGSLVEDASHMCGQLGWIFCKIVVEVIHNPTRKGIRIIIA